MTVLTLVLWGDSTIISLKSLNCITLMCCSRKYPYPYHGRFFKLNPHPSRNFILVSYFHSKNWAFETPLPLGISINLPNVESDDVIGGSTKTVQHSIKNISRNIGAVFFKLGTRNVHHKRNIMTPTMLLPGQHSRLQSLSVKNQISPFAIF